MKTSPLFDNGEVFAPDLISTTLVDKFNSLTQCGCGEFVQYIREHDGKISKEDPEFVKFVNTLEEKKHTQKLRDLTDTEAKCSLGLVKATLNLLGLVLQTGGRRRENGSLVQQYNLVSAFGGDKDNPDPEKREGIFKYRTTYYEGHEPKQPRALKKLKRPAPPVTEVQPQPQPQPVIAQEEAKSVQVALEPKVEPAAAPMPEPDALKPPEMESIFTIRPVSSKSRYGEEDYQFEAEVDYRSRMKPKYPIAEEQPYMLKVGDLVVSRYTGAAGEVYYHDELFVVTYVDWHDRYFVEPKYSLSRINADGSETPLPCPHHRSRLELVNMSSTNLTAPAPVR